MNPLLSPKLLIMIATAAGIGMVTLLRRARKRREEAELWASVTDPVE